MSLLCYYCTLTEYPMDKYDLGNNKETKQFVLNFFFKINDIKDFTLV